MPPRTPRSSSSGYDPTNLEAMVARIDERTENTEQAVREIRNNLAISYVSQDAFKALSEKVGTHQRMLFGLAFLIIASVIGAILKLVIYSGAA